MSPRGKNGQHAKYGLVTEFLAWLLSSPNSPGNGWAECLNVSENHSALHGFIAKLQGEINVREIGKL